jgi:hypothetical protein
VGEASLLPLAVASAAGCAATSFCGLAMNPDLPHLLAFHAVCSQERLEKLRLDLSEQYGGEIRDVPILIGDIKDQVGWLDVISACMCGQAAWVLTAGAPCPVLAAGASSPGQL